MNVGLECGERRVEVFDHLLRRHGESVAGGFAQAARLVDQRHIAVPVVEAAGAQHQRMRGRIDHGQVHQR